MIALAPLAPLLLVAVGGFVGWVIRDTRQEKPKPRDEPLTKEDVAQAVDKVFRK